MSSWKCSECPVPCILDREAAFPPEQCIYVNRGNGFRTARWNIYNRYSFLDETLNEGDGVYRP